MAEFVWDVLVVDVPQMGGDLVECSPGLTPLLLHDFGGVDVALEVPQRPHNPLAIPPRDSRCLDVMRGDARLA